MTKSNMPHPRSPYLTVELVKDTFNLHHNQSPLALSQKWVVFYTLLAVNSERHVSTDEVCDHHPWSRLTPDIAGRDLWRFTRAQEEKHFGERITSSPARQATKLFTLTPDITRRLRFLPDQATVSDQLRSLRQHRNQVAMELGECALLLQSGLVQQAIDRLQELRAQNLNVNDLAHTETILTMCLDEHYGIRGTAGQVGVLKDFLKHAGLSRLNRARVLIRLARHYTLSAQYDEARHHYAALRMLLMPEDGIEYCWYHINYGLFLRRTGQLDEALHHQRLAHDAAQVAQWWHGLYSARYNLALMHLTVAENSPQLARQRHLQQALEWAMKAYATVVLTRQPISMTDCAMLIAILHRHLGHVQKARHWLNQALRSPIYHPQQHPHQAVVYTELSLLEEQAGNYFLAGLARDKANSLLHGAAEGEAHG